MNTEQITNRLRILKLSLEADVSHLGSALSAIDLVDGVYRNLKSEEKFVLSNGHAASALYVVLEKYGYLEDPRIEVLGVHPERNLGKGIEVSTGSLGQGLPIAVGMALVDRSKKVFCTISDGECAEGSIWEALRIASKSKLNNLVVIVNANDFAGYEEIDSAGLIPMFCAFGCEVVAIDGHDCEQIDIALNYKSTQPLVVFAKTSVDQLPFLSGLDAHYYKMTKEDYQTAKDIWLKK